MQQQKRCNCVTDGLSNSTVSQLTDQERIKRVADCPRVTGLSCFKCFNAFGWSGHMTSRLLKTGASYLRRRSFRTNGGTKSRGKWPTQARLGNAACAFMNLGFYCLPHPGGVQRIVVSLSACGFVYSLTSQKVRVQTSRNSLYLLPVAVARSSTDYSAIRYVLPVLWMTSCFHVMAQIQVQA